MERELLIHAPLEEVVLSYAANAAAAGWTVWSAPRWRPEPSTGAAGPTS